MTKGYKIYNIPKGQEITAMQTAMQFSADYPDRVGIRNGVIYGWHGKSLYAYRTAAGLIVVRGTS